MKSWSWKSFIIGAAAALVLGVTPIAFYAAVQVGQAEYEACMARQGYDLPISGVQSDEELDQAIDAAGNC